MTAADATRRAIEGLTVQGHRVEPDIGDDGAPACSGRACPASVACFAFATMRRRRDPCPHAVKAMASLLARMLGETEAAG